MYLFRVIIQDIIGSSLLLFCIVVCIKIVSGIVGGSKVRITHNC